MRVNVLATLILLLALLTSSISMVSVNSSGNLPAVVNSFSQTAANASNFRSANETVHYLEPHSTIYRFQDISGLSYDTASGYLFVSNGPLGTITVYNPTSNSGVGFINGSSYFGYSLYDRQNNALYVDGPSGDVLVVNCSTYQIIKDITGFSPGTGSMVLDTSNGMLYVKSQTKSEGYIFAIDPSSNTIVRKISGFLPGNSLTYDSSNHLIYTIQNNNTVASLDTSDYAINTKAFILTNESQHTTPYSIVYLADGNYLSVGEYSYSFSATSTNAFTSMQLVNVRTGTLVNSSRTGSLQFALSPQDSGIYDPFTHNAVVAGLYSINFQNETSFISRSLPNSDWNTGEFAVNPQTGVVYVSLSSQIMEIKGNGTSISFVGNYLQDPTAMTYDSENNNLYLANKNGNYLTVVNASTNAITGTIGNLSHPYMVQYDPYWNDLIVTEEHFTYSSDILNTSVVSTDNGTVIHNFNSRLVAVDPATGNYYLGNGETISIVSGTNWSYVENISLGQRVSMVYSDRQTGNVVVGASRALFVLNGTNNSVINSYRLPGNLSNSSKWWWEGATEMVTDPSGLNAYIYAPYNGLWKLNLSTGKTSWTIRPDLDGYELISYDPHDHYIYACNGLFLQVYVFNSTTGQKIAALDLPMADQAYLNGGMFEVNSVFYNPKTQGIYMPFGDYTSGGGALNVLNFTYIVVKPPELLLAFKVTVAASAIAASAAAIYLLFRKRYLP